MVGSFIRMDRSSIMNTDTAAEDAQVARRGAREDREDGMGAVDGSDERFAYQPLWVRLACIGLDFLTQTYDQVRIVPEIALFEQYVCRAHYGQDAIISHELCRDHHVQYQLARLRSWKALFDGITSMDQENLVSPPCAVSLTPRRSPSHGHSHGHSRRQDRAEEGDSHEHPGAYTTAMLGTCRL